MKVNAKTVVLTNAQMHAQNNNMQELANTILHEVEEMLEEELILEFKKNLPAMFKVLSKVSKLDIGLSFVEYIQSSKSVMTRPILVTKSTAELLPYLNLNEPLIYMLRAVNPLLSVKAVQNQVPNDVFLDS